MKSMSIYARQSLLFENMFLCSRRSGEWEFEGEQSLRFDSRVLCELLRAKGLRNGESVRI